MEQHVEGRDIVERDDSGKEEPQNRGENEEEPGLPPASGSRRAPLRSGRRLLFGILRHPFLLLVAHRPSPFEILRFRRCVLSGIRCRSIEFPAHRRLQPGLRHVQLADHAQVLLAEVEYGHQGIHVASGSRSSPPGTLRGWTGPTAPPGGSASSGTASPPPRSSKGTRARRRSRWPPRRPGSPRRGSPSPSRPSSPGSPARSSLSSRSEASSTPWRRTCPSASSRRASRPAACRRWRPRSPACTRAPRARPTTSPSRSAPGSACRAGRSAR